MICKKCNMELASWYKYCPRCGTEVEVEYFKKPEESKIYKLEKKEDEDLLI